MLLAFYADIGVTKDIPGRVSFTFDTWTSEAGYPYLSMTGHYIAGHKESPQDWELKSEQLGFTHIEGNHSGANLGGILIRIIDRYGIRQKASILSFEYFFSPLFLPTHAKVGWFTADNASNNFSAIREVARQLKDDLHDDLTDWDPKQHYIR